MDQKRKTLMIVRHIAYTLILFVCYILQTTPRLLEIMGARPNLIVPVVVAVAMYEGEYAGGIYGALGGLLWDNGSSSLFGIGGMFFLIAGCAIGLLTIYLVQNSRKMAYTMTFATAAIHGTLTYSFVYGMWGYDNAYLMFARQTIPTIIYTTLLAGVVYNIIGRVNGYFEELIGD